MAPSGPETKYPPGRREDSGSGRDPEERRTETKAELREKMLDKTLADYFPTSDPPSSIPDPVAADSLKPEAPPAGMVEDPVCHRHVETANSTIRADYEGKTFHFCSEECKEIFQVNPAPYGKAA